VVQVRAAVASGGNGAGRHHAAARDRVDLGAANGSFQNGRILGEISQEVYVEVEADDHRFVFLAHDLMHETRRCVLFGVQDILHAAAGVDQDSEGDRHVRLFGEVGNFLFLAIFQDLEIVFAQVGNDAVMLV